VSALTLDGVDVMGERLAAEVRRHIYVLFYLHLWSWTLFDVTKMHVRFLILFRENQISVKSPLLHILWEGLQQDMQLGNCTSPLIRKMLKTR